MMKMPGGPRPEESDDKAVVRFTDPKKATMEW
jgi:hypothetical protein